MPISRAHHLIDTAAYAVPAGIGAWLLHFDIFKVFATTVIAVLTIALLCLQLDAAIRRRAKELADADGGD